MRAAFGRSAGFFPYRRAGRTGALLLTRMKALFAADGCDTRYDCLRPLLLNRPIGTMTCAYPRRAADSAAPDPAPVL